MIAQQLWLQYAPNPPLSLQLFRNGILLQAGADYYLTDQTIRLVTDPAPDDTWQAF